MSSFKPCALAVLVVTVSSPAAIAQDNTRAEQLYEQGVRFYNLAQYDKAAEAFQQAYSLSGQPGLLFNIAQAFRLANRCDDALELYRSYLRSEPDAPARETVQRRIAEMEACARAAHPTPPDRPSLPSARSNVWLWTLGGASVAFAGGGAALLVSTGYALDGCSPRCAPERVDDLRLRAGFGYGFLAAAGVSAITTGWLWYRTRDSDRRAVGLSLAPSGVAVWSAF